MAMKILITGNPQKGLAAELARIWPDATFVSRSTGHDLTNDSTWDAVADLALEHDAFINSSALWRFNQTLLLQKVYTRSVEAKHDLRIVCIGSTVDRGTKGSDWIYQQEKKALRSYCNSLNMLSTWNGGPRITLISLGSLSNVQHKHPDRICMPIDSAAAYVKWVLDQPNDVVVNEVSIDPRQRQDWHE